MAFTEQQITQIIQMYEGERLSVDSIAQYLNASPSSVWRALRRNGVTLRGQSRRAKIDTDEIVKRYLAGQSSNEIAESFGMRGESIRYRLRRAGVIIRSKSEATLTYRALETEWTPERIEKLKELWRAGTATSEIRKQLGISYQDKAVTEKAKALGLEPRRQPKSASEISVLASAVTAANQYQHETLLTFLPENPELETEWRAILSQVRRERAAAAEAARL